MDRNFPEDRVMAGESHERPREPQSRHHRRDEYLEDSSRARIRALARKRSRLFSSLAYGWRS